MACLKPTKIAQQTLHVPSSVFVRPIKRSAGSAHIKSDAPHTGCGPCVDAKATAQIARFRTHVGVLGGTWALHASAASTAATKDGAFHSKLNASKISLPFRNNR